VLSTKLSTEYYNALQTIRNQVYQKEGNDQPTVSEFLRFTIVNVIDEMRKRQRFSPLRT
jgi:hypothetical protein